MLEPVQNLSNPVETIIFQDNCRHFMSHCYPSNIDREQFNKIKPLLKSARKKTHPSPHFSQNLEKVGRDVVRDASRMRSRPLSSR